MRWAAIFLICLFHLPAAAAPDLESYQDIDGVRIYQDHEHKTIWYPSPAPPALDEGPDQVPDYSLDFYRYLGRSGTGDQEVYWSKGVFSAGIQRGRDPDTPRRIRKVLQSKGISSPRLLSMPVSETRITLLFSDHSRTWTRKSRWSSERMVLALDPKPAQILWESVSAGQTLISISVEERLAGVRRKDEAWVESETVLVSTIPVTLDIEKYPASFRKTDLGGRMVKGYTGLDVFCFDFLERPDGALYAKIVEVAIPTAGRDLVEALTFRPDGIYRFRINFRLAKDLDRPYRMRITRVLKDGRRLVGRWKEQYGEDMIDITAYDAIQDN